MNGQREELKKEIESMDSTEILKDILVELRLLNLFIASSQKRAKQHQFKAQEEVDKIRNALPTEAKKIFDSISKGVIK